MIPDIRQLFKPGDKVLCALSGGPDSVALTHLLANNAGLWGIRVAAAHFSHGLRPADAAAEYALCVRLCRDLRIPLFYGAGDTAGYAADHHLGTEEAARALRYSFLRATGARWGADLIATGHHLDDQAETVLFRLCRGAGALGLRGIPEKEQGLVRPLLGVDRAWVRSYLKKHRLEAAEDPSNASHDFARNRLRHSLLPLLEQVHGGAARNIAAAARLAAEDEDFIAPFAAELAEKAAPVPGGCAMEAELLLAAHPAVRSRALRLLCAAVAGQTPGLRQLQAVEALLRAGPSAQAHLPGLLARREYGRLLLTVPREAPTAPPPMALAPGENRWGDHSITVSGPGFTVRSRQPGDRVVHRGRHRDLKKLLIDLKVPRGLRDAVPVVCLEGQPVLCGLPPWPCRWAQNGSQIEIKRNEEAPHDEPEHV